MRKLVNRFRQDEEGAALVAESGMLVGLIAVICIAAVTLLGTRDQYRVQRYRSRPIGNLSADFSTHADDPKDKERGRSAC